jgi:hypothetical protein
MKKIALFVVALVMSVAANAQFEKGKGYLGASLSGFDLSSQAKHFHLGLDVKAGYLFADNLMVTGQVGYNHLEDAKDTYQFGLGGRYYIVQNGLYLGAGARYKHEHEYDDFMPNVNIGYAFFLSRTVTIEPELYYDFSMKDFKEYSGFGLRVGVGIYLDELF